MRQCKQCGVEYEAKRADSLYCSGACRALSSKLGALSKQLPADVQAEIEAMCNEATGIDRPGHSRADMIERALRYQAHAGRRGYSLHTDVKDSSKPGDPEYGPLGTNTCKRCGRPTGHKLVVKCGSCCWGAVA